MSRQMHSPSAPQQAEGPLGAAAGGASAQHSGAAQAGLGQAGIGQAGIGQAAIGAGSLWASFVSPKSEALRLTAWLALLCQRVPRCVFGLVLEFDPASNSYQPVAAVPDPKRSFERLVPSAEKVISSNRPASLPQEGGHLHIGYPITLEASRPPAYAVVLEMSSGESAEVQQALREVHWAAGWLAAQGWEGRAGAEQAALQRTGLALDMLALAAEHPRLEAAAMALVNELQTAFHAQRVTLGMVTGRGHAPRVRALALSYSAWFRQNSTLAEGLETALEECFDQQVSVSLPPLPSLSRSITVAHAEHLKTSGMRHLLSVPLADASGPVGAMLLERQEDRPFTEAEREMAEAVAALLGPVLELKRKERRWFAGRLVDLGTEGARRFLGPRHLSWKLGAIAAFCVTLAALTVHVPFRLQADATLRPATSRAISAPFAGFIAEAPLRAGDQVQAGDLVLRLEDADLQLEALRWRSEVDRLISESREALAKKDRAQVALSEAKIAQGRAQAALAEAELARSRVLAPIDGLVVAGDLSQRLGAPVQLGDVLFEIAPLDAYRVEIAMPEADLRYVTPEMTGRLTLTGLPSGGLDLTVTRITPMAEVQNGLNTFRVEASLTAPPEGLRPGMEGVAKLDAGRALAVWVWTRGLRDWLRAKMWTWAP